MKEATMGCWRSEWTLSNLIIPRALRIALTLCCWGILTGAAACLGADPPPQARAQEARAAAPRPVIEYHGDRLSVQVHQAPWAAVLQELERHAGIQIQVKGTLAGTLTQTFESLPLEQGLRRLLRDAHLIFFYTSGPTGSSATDQLTRVWLVPKEDRTAEATSRRHPPTRAAAQPPQEVLSALGMPAEAIPTQEEAALAGDPTAEGDQETRLTALHTAVWQGQTEALRQAILDPDQTIQTTAVELLAERDPQGAVAVLLGAAKHAQSPVRLQALDLLQQLNQADERTALSALEEALTDADATVKNYAIHALAERGGPSALGSLRRALHDPDPAVRMRVLESVQQTEHGVLILQDALADEDATVRALAGFWREHAALEGQ
jgi:hypothetical protein